MSLVHNFEKKNRMLFSNLFHQGQGTTRSVFIVCLGVFTCVCTTCVLCLCRPEERVRTTGTEIKDGLVLLHGCSEPNLVLLQECQEHATPEPGLQPQTHLFCKFRKHCLSFTFERIPRDKNPFVLSFN